MFALLLRYLAYCNLLSHEGGVLLEEELGQGRPLGWHELLRRRFRLRGHQPYVEVQHLVDVVVEPVRLRTWTGGGGGARTTNDAAA